MSRRAVAAAVAGLAVLTACSSTGSSPTSAPSTPPSVSLSPTVGATATGSKTAAASALAGFQNQQLSWHGCYDGLQCSTMLVPLDYTKPTGKRLHIAVIREQASGNSEGSLIIN